MLGEKIRDLRKENKISQEELAEKLGVSRQSISLWENGQTMPSIDNIVSIADIFNVSTDVLLKNNEEPKAEEKVEVIHKTKKPIKKKLIVILSVVLALVIAVSAFIVIDKFVNPKLSAEEIFESIAPSTVEIQATSIDFKSTGTGFFIDDKGTIITNYHVIEDCFDADILLQDGTKHPVLAVLGYDKDLDIAILSTGCGSSVPLEYRENSVSTGEKAYTLGSSLGLTGTFAEGIISSTNRKIEGSNFIQTTAPISSGNSGGPLVDEYGKVIGITTAGFEEGQNLNLAVPIVLAINVDRNQNIGLQNLFFKQYRVLNQWEEIHAKGLLSLYVANPNEETRADLIDFLKHN